MSAPKISVAPAVMAWALQRSESGRDVVEEKFPDLSKWLSQERKPTLRQLEKFAAHTHTPIGFFFLDEPPDEVIPIPDFRTPRDTGIRGASADLLDVIYDCQLRQQWYRDYAREIGLKQVQLVGALDIQSDAAEAANAIRTFISLPTWNRGSTWDEAFRNMTRLAEERGFLIMTSGIVGSNTHRRLKPDEFRGFCLVDDFAPLIFINGADTKAANIFTLAHELAHLTIGEAGVDAAQPEALTQETMIERWCNEVASELLVPLDALTKAYRQQSSLAEELERLARDFKVSTLVVLNQLWSGRLLDMTWEEYRHEWGVERHRVQELLDSNTRGSSGGNFYNTLPVRVSRRFAKAIVSATLDGRTPYREAAQMLGLKKSETFTKLSQELGLVA